MIGQEISHYRIVEKIGEGGMGVVYRAEDLVLKRSVALKFLSNEALGNEEERERFLREAQAAAALDHPAICTVYEVSQSDDRTFLAMAYLQGETLRQRVEKEPLEVADAVRVAVQVLEGLQDAHEEGIVHRDIKSANIMITSKGRATIMDFGLAQLPGAARITQMGTTLGTAAYMSPEQAEGGEIDHRSDLWSLGVVLYESLTGSFPFAGAYIPALMYAIVHEEARPLEGVDGKYREDLGKIISKALTKPVRERYQHASEMLADLNALQQIHGLNLGSGSTTVIKPKAAVATPPLKPQPPAQPVQPLPATSPPPAQRSPWSWVAAGVVGASLAGGALWFMTQGTTGQPEPIATEATIAPLKSDDAAEPSSPEPSPTEDQPPEGQPPAERQQTSPASNDERDLGADPSTARMPEVTPPLPMPRDGRTPPPRPTGRRELSGPMLLRARQAIDNGGPRGVSNAVRMLQRETQMRPQSAGAHALLAKAHALEGFLALGTPSDVLPLAKASAETALSLDGSSTDAHLAQAITLALHDRDWPGAQAAFEQARASAPDSADTHQYFALAYLAPQGRLDEALAEMQQAVRLKPADLELQTWLGRIYSFRGEHDRAIEQLNKVAGTNASHSAPLWGLGLAQAASGDVTASRETFQRMAKVAPNNPYAFAGTAYVEALAGGLSGSRGENRRALKNRFGGRPKGSRKRGAGQQYVSPYLRAIVEAARGRKDTAFTYLKEGVEQRDPFVARAKVQPELVKLRSDPRFSDLLTQMNLTP